VVMPPRSLTYIERTGQTNISMDLSPLPSALTSIYTVYAASARPILCLAQ